MHMQQANRLNSGLFWNLDDKEGLDWDPLGNDGTGNLIRDLIYVTLRDFTCRNERSELYENGRNARMAARNGFRLSAPPRPVHLTMPPHYVRWIILELNASAR